MIPQGNAERIFNPNGRGFEYVPFAKDGTYQPIDELF
jgi:hypothetical protein